jgi:hypothetical protein
VQHGGNDFLGGCHTAFHHEGNPGKSARAQINPASTREGVKAG